MYGLFLVPACATDSFGVLYSQKEMKAVPTPGRRRTIAMRITLRENGLNVLEEVCPLSARMVVNQVSMKMEDERIRNLIRDLRNVISK